MENDTLVIIVFYSATFILISLILLFHELDLQYKRMIKYAFA
jgi:hypothetical protein